MRVVLDNPAGRQADVELRLGREDATVGDLLDAIPKAADARGIVLDGRFCHVDLALSEIGLYEGARIHPAAGAPRSGEPATAVLELRVIAGFDAGRRVPLPATGVVVGRDAECDVVLGDDGVSRRHLRVQPSPGGLRATVSDLESVNGTWVEGKRIKAPTDVEPETVFEAGDVAFTIAAQTPSVPVDPVRQASQAGTIAFNRPPRARGVAPGDPLSVPEQPGQTSRPRFSIASAVGPLVMGGVMVIVLHNIIYALFMLLSPILVIGSWIEQRRHAKRSSRSEQREYAQKMATFTRQVGQRQAEELAGQRQALPDLAEINRRATGPDSHLWERRPDDDDFLTLSAGYGEVPFRPPLADRQTPGEAAEVVLAEHGWLQLAPVPVQLSNGGVVGIVGDREQALALARALICQAAVLQGPADLTAAVFTEQPAREEWDWVKWLPHSRDAAGASGRLLAVGAAAGATLAGELAERDDDDPRYVLAVLDSPALIEGRGAAGRMLLRGQKVSGIVLARSSERLPAACTTVIELADEAGEARLSRPQTGERVDPLLVAGVSADTARACALALARFEDADLQLLGGALPDFVGLLSLIGLVEADAAEIRDRWRSSAGQTSLTASFALSEDGPLHVDLVADGPHGLVAGTTGAGKSELLRSLVAALAAEHPPTRVNFVLIDYKGGSAFAQCAELPHTVGMVTDLDEHLGERALRSLEAELRYRERVLRDHRASDLIEHDRLVADGQATPLPRLLVIIDEFATLAAELPDFVPSLVGIAQRGRSLGVHMILATQRPTGAVNENIRANTNLRVCLRVQTPQDSSDVIDSPAAAKIPRKQPGRAHVRLGPSELIPVQTALVTGSTAADQSAIVAVEPFVLPAEGETADAVGRTAEDSASDLQRLVVAAGHAFADAEPPRRPWLPPLEAEVALDQLLELGPPRPLGGERGLVVPFALADDPEAQAQYPVGWNLDAGNLLLYGIGGSGTTTTLATLALALAGLTDPGRLHVYVLDFGAGELSALRSLPHVGAVIGAAEHERQRRLLRRLRGELQSRRGLDPAARAGVPRVVLLLDGYAGFASEHGDLAGDALREALARVWADGPELGIHTAIAADRLGAVPTALASLAQQRLAFQLADVADYAQFGLMRRSIPQFTAGRAVVGGSTQVIQVARAARNLETEVGIHARSVVGARGGAAGARGGAAGARGGAAGARGGALVEGGPPPVDVLPESLPFDALLGAGRSAREPLFVPIGIGDETLEPAGFELFEGDHAMIAGPPRAGRTTSLLVVAEVVSRLYPEIQLLGVAGRRSALRDCAALARVVTDVGQLTELAAELRDSDQLQMLLIDDADSVDDPARALSDLFSATLPNLHAVVAGRTDALKTLGHWSVGVRRSRTGLLLQPEVQVDGALLGVTLPRRPVPPVRPGCGYRIDPGGFELVQVAQAQVSREPVG